MVMWVAFLGGGFELKVKSAQLAPPCKLAAAAEHIIAAATAVAGNAAAAAHHSGDRPPLRGARALSAGMSAFAELDAAAAAAAEPTRWGGPGTVAFVSGNEWMVDFMLNEMLHLERQAVPLRMLWVPLDAGALARLRSHGNGTAYAGAAASGRFTGARSDFRNAAYNAMSLFKWEFSVELLQRGYDVFMLDPDLAIKRNPLPYIETLGDCDLYLSLDSVDYDPTGPEVRARGGYVAHDPKLADNYYNTGVVYMRARPRTVAFLRAYMSWAKDRVSGGSMDDDQALFNFYVNEEHVLQRGSAAKGEYTASRVMANGCLDYQKRGGSGSVSGGSGGDAAYSDSAVVATMYPLNPFLFLNSRHIGTLPERILHRPFIWHANWAHGGQKQPMLADRGDWLLKTPPPTTLQ